jgi:hypothetical protein
VATVAAGGAATPDEAAFGETADENDLPEGRGAAFAASAAAFAAALASRIISLTLLTALPALLLSALDDDWVDDAWIVAAELAAAGATGPQGRQ